MPSYGEYLKIDELLALQRPLSEGPEHDEMLFIVIHQVYELWFKEILHELDHLERLLSRNDGARARHTLKRILTILKVMVAQLDILETMTPLEFLSFRDRLEAASGFQSHQFRELEFALGWKDAKALERYPGGQRDPARLERRLEAGSLWDAFLRYLAANGVPVPRADLERDVTRRVEPSPELREVLVEVYRQPAEAGRAVRAAGGSRRRAHGVALPAREDGAAHDRHRRGTGGSAGADYLLPRSTSRCFRTSGPSAPSCDTPAWTPRPSTAPPTRSRPTTPGSACPSGCCSPGTRTRPGPTAASTARWRPGWTRRATWTTSGSTRSPRPSGCARDSPGCWATPGGGIALAANTHELVVRLLSALPLRTRPRLVTTDGEFHTIRRQLDRLAEEGLDRRPGPRGAARVAGRPARRAVDDRTALVLVSAVFFDTGRIARGLGEVAASCRRHGSRLLVDAYHALNVVPFSLADEGLGDAFVVGGGYKYCQLGEGNCFLRIPPDTDLRPVVTGWYSEFTALAERQRAERVAYGQGGDRFAGATYDPTSHYRAAAGVRLLPRARTHARAAAGGEPASDRAARLGVRRARSRPRGLSRDRAVRSTRSADFSRSDRRWRPRWRGASCARGLDRCPRRGPPARSRTLPVRRQLRDAIGLLGEVVRA